MKGTRHNVFNKIGIFCVVKFIGYIDRQPITFFFLYSISVSPESVVIPIVSCIFGFPLLALLVICCLRHRAKLARERDRRRNYDINDHAVSLVRITKISNRLRESLIKMLNLSKTEHANFSSFLRYLVEIPFLIPRKFIVINSLKHSVVNDVF